MVNEVFSKELIELAEKDLSLREKLASEGKLSGCYHPEMEFMHRDNAQRLRRIIKEIGFPTISKVGVEASNAAWLIIQHSISEPEFMKECLRMMMENIDNVSPANVAYLHDRIEVFQSRPQRYGTQLTAEGIRYPVEDKGKLNEERLKMNLPAFSQEEINRISNLENILEIEGKDTDYIAWRKKTGWIV